VLFHPLQQLQIEVQIIFSQQEHYWYTSPIQLPEINLKYSSVDGILSLIFILAAGRFFLFSEIGAPANTI
jgi:hypothetical protein